ncbi:MAG TPA: TetR/AcrR family transcriptional regulator [Stellaceae bacterium]|nr:TetR/AcrR family transcriptional regulator [Stellaceae bacterium]
MRGTTAEKAGRPRPTRRAQDPEGVQKNIIEIATQEFAANGYNGARVDEIAARTNTSKRMLYYYFGDKEGLFRAVLEEGYRRMRQVEEKRRYDHLEPEAALRALVEFTFEHQNANEDFIRLVMVENIHNGVHLARSENIERLNVPAITTLRDIYQRGVAATVFRPGLDVVDLHMSISALSFFNVANRATFSRIFRREMGTPTAMSRRKKIVGDLILRYVKAAPES